MMQLYTWVTLALFIFTITGARAQGRLTPGKVLSRFIASCLWPLTYGLSLALIVFKADKHQPPVAVALPELEDDHGDHETPDKERPAQG